MSKRSKADWDAAIQAERDRLPETLRLFGDTLNVFCRAGSDSEAKFEMPVAWLFALWEEATLLRAQLECFKAVAGREHGPGSD